MWRWQSGNVQEPSCVTQSAGIGFRLTFGLLLCQDKESDKTNPLNDYFKKTPALPPSTMKTTSRFTIPPFTIDHSPFTLSRFRHYPARCPQSYYRPQCVALASENARTIGFRLTFLGYFLCQDKKWQKNPERLKKKTRISSINKKTITSHLTLHHWPFTIDALHFTLSRHTIRGHFV